VSAAQEIELLEADERHYKDRVALLRARLYRWGQAPTPQLRELERRLAAAQRRLRERRSREPS
jgi:hypothetical protein